MIELVTLLFPQSISLMIHNNISKRKGSVTDNITTYMGYVCLTNIIVLGLLFIKHSDTFSFVDSFDNISFVFKTFVMNILLSIISPIIVCYIKKVFTFNIEFKVKNGKKNN